MDERPLLPRPANSVGGGLQHERTALAWERTAIAMMVAGLALARFGAQDGHYLLGSAGVIQTVVGGALLIGAGTNNDELHNPATSASAAPQVTLARMVGMATILFAAVGLLLTVVMTFNAIGIT